MAEHERDVESGEPSATPAPERTEPAEDAPETAEIPEAGDTSADPATPDAAEAADEADKPAGGAAARPRGALALTVSVIGELMITAGVVMALFVVYSLWWTNVVANREADRKAEKVRDHWAQDRGPDGPGDVNLKEGIGFLRVPSMKDDDILVTRGTATSELNHGTAGYYTKPVKSALPWDQSGNFALAAHRDGHGAKFHDIDKIDKGDPIVFETKNTWYIYKVYKTLPKTSKYNVDVLREIPKVSGKTEAGRYITLTTCTPVYTSKHRYIVWGELVRTESVDAERTPPREIR